MEKTKVDDLLMEMIQPKVQEIETRFSKGEGLSNTDINTLLLKSQYNHIHHLDKKLDEITATVVNLEYKFDSLKNSLEDKFSLHETKIGLKMQRAINVNMRWGMAMIAFIVTALKVVDTIFMK